MKKILSFICSVFVSASAISTSLLIGQGNIASALSSSESVVFPQNSSISSTVDSTLYTNAYNKLKENTNLPDDCYVLLNINGVNCEVFIISPDFDHEYSFLDGFWGGTTTVYFADCVQFFCNYEYLDDYTFSLETYDYTSTTQFRLAYNSDLIFPWFAVNTQISNGNPVVINNNPNYRAFFNHTLPPYAPDFTGPLVGFPVGLEFSVSDFMQWLVDNDKIAVSVDSGGASVGGKIPAYIGMSKLQSFLEFYKQFGGSNTSFVSRIWSWFSYMNIANQTNDNIVILKNTVDSLYREYINSYKHEFYSNSANQAHHRRNVNTQTTDDELLLVTDTASDDIYTTLLREIIRGIVALQSSTVSGFRAVIDTLNNLDFSVNVANNGGEFPSIDLASLYTYDSDAFSDDLQAFEANVEEVQNIPQGYIDTINQNSLMPENMLSDKNSLTVNVPCITGFTISNNGSSYSTQTGTYTLSSSQYPWLDTVVQKIKRFASIILIIGYLVHLRYRIPELVRGE